MASIVAMIGGAIINAVAFTGSGYLFSKLGKKNDREKEYRRHNLEMESQSREKFEYEKYRMKIMDELRDQGIAAKDFKTLGDAMDQYYKVTGIRLNSFESYRDDDEDYDEIIELALILGGVYTTILIFYRYY